jgi:hypothetical protein
LLAQAILTERREILHRIDLVQNIVLHNITKRLKAAVKDVKDADKELSEKLEEIRQIKKLVDTVKVFLAIVDKAIDLAKVL